MSASPISISLITPTYNERENIALLAKEVFSVLDGNTEIDLELIVVDDNSPDGTGDIAEELCVKFPVKVVHRSGKLGLGSAVMEGFKKSDREYLGVIDADLSHDPIVLPDLIMGLRDFDLTIGSRYDADSKVEKWPWYRKLISQTGVFLAQKLTGVQDPLAGYFFLRREVLGNMTLTSPGYKILLEILVKGEYRNFLEVPFVFRNRQFSSSKLNVKEYYLFSKQLMLFSLRKLRRDKR